MHLKTLGRGTGWVGYVLTNLEVPIHGGSRPNHIILSGFINFYMTPLHMVNGECEERGPLHRPLLLWMDLIFRLLATQGK